MLVHLGENRRVPVESKNQEIMRHLSLALNEESLSRGLARARFRGGKPCIEKCPVVLSNARKKRPQDRHEEPIRVKKSDNQSHPQ